MMESRTENQRTLLTEVITGPNANTVYSGIIAELRPNFELQNRRISIGYIASAAMNAAARVGLYGSFTPGGAKVLVAANVGGDATPSATAWTYGAVDLNAVPMPYYFIGVSSSADESAKTLSVAVSD
jgi:hypothetical protein